jgi:acyl carrier protein
VIESPKATTVCRHGGDSWSKTVTSGFAGYVVLLLHIWNRENPTMPDSIVQSSQEADLARLMVKTLNLDLTADTIDPLAPLFHDGLGLDSIDILELALAISQAYSVQLRADNEDNEAIFRSLRSLNDHVQRQRSA